MAQVLCKPEVPDVPFKNYATVHCGKLAVELALITADKSQAVSDQPPKVASTTAGGMLPRDMEKSLQAVGLVNAGILSFQDNASSVQIAWLQEQIDKGRPAILFTGHGAGHWITVWGYDKEEGNFYVFDTARGAKRNDDGLTIYSETELIADWNKLPWTVRYFVNPLSQMQIYQATAVVPW